MLPKRLYSSYILTRDGRMDFWQMTLMRVSLSSIVEHQALAMGGPSMPVSPGM
jgi:hypothetical protein